MLLTCLSAHACAMQVVALEEATEGPIPHCCTCMWAAHMPSPVTEMIFGVPRLHGNT